ncbi:MAG: RNA-binding S4 domain-containing protein [Clostridia bacterium]|jgi:ribosomal 50S subunit-recycling heat shock protein
MRLDKFLQVSRLIKRRTVAKEVAEGGRVSINGRPAKPSTAVEVGDRLLIDLPRGRLQVEVLEVKDHVPAKAAASLYRVIEGRDVDDL